MADVLALEKYLRSIANEGICLAYSGGIDSTVLLAILQKIYLQSPFNIKVCYCCSELQSEKDNEEAFSGIEALNFEKHFLVINLDLLKLKQIRENSRDRCYYCKREFFQAIRSCADFHMLRYVLDGSNYDDSKTFRPGRRVLKELEIISPFHLFQFTKQEIVLLAKNLGVRLFASNSCLATRFPYGKNLNEKELQMVARGEACFLERGFSQVRLRYHEDLLRIELIPEEFNLLLDQRDELIRLLKELGFNYITLDLAGFRSGSFDTI